MKSQLNVNDQQFLAGGGEMGMLTRAKDWEATSLGHPHTWPQSLRTTLSIILNSRFPMFLWWGAELTCFYNDAYRPSLGMNGKHPSILGQPAADAWPEIWDIIKPLIDQVLAEGVSTWSEDQLIPIYRNGGIEDVYWTFSYSPVNDESGRSSGVLVTCYETTEKIKILKDIEEREDQLGFILDAAELGTWDLNPATNKFTGNVRLKEWFGLPADAEIELPSALAAIAEKDRQNVIDAIQAAMQPGSGNYDVEYTIIHPQTGRERIVIAKGKALFDADGKAYRFSGTLQDITNQVTARQTIEKSEKEFRNTVKQSPVGITIFRGTEFVVEMANDTYLQIVDRKECDFVGKPLFDSLPEVRESVSGLLTDVYTTGISYHGTEFPVTLNRFGKKELTYFNFVYQAFREESGEISGIIVVATDVTSSVKAKHNLAESEKQFRSLVMQSPIPMAIFRGKDHVIEAGNKVMFEKIWRRKEYDVLGKKLLAVFPELAAQKFPELLDSAFATGRAYREKEAIAYVQGDDELRRFYFDYEYAPLFEPDGSVSGIIITVNDVTEKVEARQGVEESEKRLSIVIEASELGIWEWNFKTDEMVCSDRYLEIFGYQPGEKVKHTTFIRQLHADDRKGRDAAVHKAIERGVLYYESRITRPDGAVHWIEAKGKVFYDDKREPLKLIGTIRDITEEKYHQEELQEREQKFRLLADSMPQFVWTGDAEGNLNYFNRSVYAYSGLTPDQIAEDGWLQIVHPDDRDENIRLWTEAVATGKDFLFEHRFCRHDGEYHWQLSRAIPQRDASGAIQMWVGTSTDIQDQKTFAEELEKQVNERTKELAEKNKALENMNTELNSFAYVSSHDLQEPLRKIQTFASRVIDRERQNLSDKGADQLAKIQEAASRMQTLIEDLLAYSRTNNSERVFSKTDLNALVDDVKNDMKETLQEKHATIEAGPMCEVNIIPFQFRQLLDNLIGNSLKFSRPGEDPYIRISSEIIKDSKAEIIPLMPAKEYCHISISDNGIGFDPQYKDRIFEVFQRLHRKDEYNGTGIGLAIVKKIVENHNGVITASSEVNSGATFDIYIPV